MGISISSNNAKLNGNRCEPERTIDTRVEPAERKQGSWRDREPKTKKAQNPMSNIIAARSIIRTDAAKPANKKQPRTRVIRKAFVKFLSDSNVFDTTIRAIGEPLRVSKPTILLEEGGHRHPNRIPLPRDQKNLMGLRPPGYPSEPSTEARPLVIRKQPC